MGEENRHQLPALQVDAATRQVVADLVQVALNATDTWSVTQANKNAEGIDLFITEQTPVLGMFTNEGDISPNAEREKVAGEIQISNFQKAAQVLVNTLKTGGYEADVNAARVIDESGEPVYPGDIAEEQYHFELSIGEEKEVLAAAISQDDKGRDILRIWVSIPKLPIDDEVTGYYEGLGHLLDIHITMPNERICSYDIDYEFRLDPNEIADGFEFSRGVSIPPKQGQRPLRLKEFNLLAGAFALLGHALKRDQESRPDRIIIQE